MSIYLNEKQSMVICTYVNESGSYGLFNIYIKCPRNAENNLWVGDEYTYYGSSIYLARLHNLFNCNRSVPFWIYFESQPLS